MKDSKVARYLTIFALFALLLGGTFVLTRTYWGGQEDPGSAMPKRPERRMVVEPRNPKTGEKTRVHYFNEKNVEVETHVFYSNGEKSIAKYRDDKTFDEYVRYYTTGELKERARYAPDGLTLIQGESYRLDGTLLETTESLPTGDRKQVKYWYDGKRVFVERILRNDGTIESTYTRKDGTLWQKTVVERETRVLVEDYDRSGKLTVRQEERFGERRIHFFDADGKLYKRQVWRWNGSYYYPVMKCFQVDEIDPATGNPTREIFYLEDGSVDRTVNYNADGTITYRQMYDGKIETETVTDATGQPVSSRTLYPDTIVMETVNPELRREPETKTPDESWRLQEQYPHYRSGEWDN